MQGTPDEAAEPLKGWKLNHVQFERGSGKAQIGYLDPEDDRFAPILTVDTGQYCQPNQAHPLAVAILSALEHAAKSTAKPVEEVVAWYVMRNAPGFRHGMRLGPFWKRSDAEEWLDDRHTLHPLCAPSLRPAEQQEESKTSARRAQIERVAHEPTAPDLATDAELSAALGWPGGISSPILDRQALLRRVAEMATQLRASEAEESNTSSATPYDRQRAAG